MVKYKILINQQKQTAQLVKLVIQEQSYYLRLVLLLCKLRQVLVIMDQMFLVVLNELILYRFLI